MTRNRTLALLAGATMVAAGLTFPAAPAPAAPAPAPAADPPGPVGGRGPGTATTAPPSDRAEVARRAAAAPPVADPLELPTSYPSQPQLRFYRDNPDDAADTPGLYTHPALAPQLTEWMEDSNRISTQVVGQSVQGRDLYLVTVTAPESEADDRPADGAGAS